MSELEDFLDSHHFLCPNLNDTFAYATADSEQITIGDGEVMARFWRDYGWHGFVAIAAVKRDRLPLPPVAETEKFRAALAELLAQKPLDSEGEPDAWTLLDEFEVRAGPTLTASAPTRSPKD